MEKKKEVLKALGASVRVKFFLKRMVAGQLASRMAASYPTWYQLLNLERRRPLEIGLFYFMPTLGSGRDKRFRQKKKRRVVDKQGRLTLL